MTVVVFHGSPRKGNTYRAAKIFLDALSACGDVRCTEFFLPEALPAFCTGCQLCLGGPYEKCPHARYTAPIVKAMMEADTLVFTTPHFGASSMSSCMKNLLDHLDFLTLNVAPRAELFDKRAFILTTGAGAVSAAGPMARGLKNWGVNRVYTLGLRMFTNEWNKMSPGKRDRFARSLCRAARGFYRARKGFPYISTIGMYYLSKWIIRRYVGVGAYSYEHWTENGFFKKRPF